MNNSWQYKRGSKKGQLQKIEKYAKLCFIINNKLIEILPKSNIVFHNHIGFDYLLYNFKYTIVYYRDFINQVPLYLTFQRQSLQVDKDNKSKFPIENACKVSFS